MEEKRRSDFSKIIEKLGHSIPEIRSAALRSLLFKIQNGILHPDLLADSVELFRAMMMWFSHDHVTSPSDILDLWRLLSSNQECCSKMLSMGAIPYLVQLKPTLSSEYQVLIKGVLDLLYSGSDMKSKWNETELIPDGNDDSETHVEGEEEWESVVQEEKTRLRIEKLGQDTRMRVLRDYRRKEKSLMHSAAAYSQGLIRFGVQSPADDSFLFELNVKLKVSDGVILRKTLRVLREMVVQDTPVWILAKHQEIFMSVVSICHSTEGQSVLQQEALRTLCSLFQSIQCFINNELMPYEKDYIRWSRQEWPAMMGFYSVARDVAFRVLCLIVPLLKSKQNMEWTVQAVRLSLSILSSHVIQNLPQEDMVEGVRQATDLMHLMQDVIEFWGAPLFVGDLDPEIQCLWYLFADILEEYSVFRFDLIKTLEKYLIEMLLDPHISMSHPHLEEFFERILQKHGSNGNIGKLMNICRRSIENWVTLQEFVAAREKGQVQADFEALHRCICSLHFDDDPVAIDGVVEMVLSTPMEWAIQSIEEDESRTKDHILTLDEARVLVCDLLSIPFESTRMLVVKCIVVLLDSLQELARRIVGNFLLFPDILYLLLAYRVHDENESTRIASLELVRRLFESINVDDEVSKNLETFAPWIQCIIPASIGNSAGSTTKVEVLCGGVSIGLLQRIENVEMPQSQLIQWLRGVFHRSEAYHTLCVTQVTKAVMKAYPSIDVSAFSVPSIRRILLSWDDEHSSIPRAASCTCDSCPDVADVESLVKIVSNTNIDLDLRKSAIDQLEVLTRFESGAQASAGMNIAEVIIGCLGESEVSWAFKSSLLKVFGNILASGKGLREQVERSEQLLLFLSMYLVTGSQDAQEAVLHCLLVLVYNFDAIQATESRLIVEDRPVYQKELTQESCVMIPSSFQDSFFFPRERRSPIQLVNMIVNTSDIDSFGGTTIRTYVGHFQDMHQNVKDEKEEGGEENDDGEGKQRGDASSVFMSPSACLHENIRHASSAEDHQTMLESLRTLRVLIEECENVQDLWEGSLFTDMFGVRRELLNATPRSPADYEVLEKVLQLWVCSVRHDMKPEVWDEDLVETLGRFMESVCVSTLRECLMERGDTSSDLVSHYFDLQRNLVVQMLHFLLSVLPILQNSKHFASFGLHRHQTLVAMLSHFCSCSPWNQDVYILTLSYKFICMFFQFIYLDETIPSKPIWLPALSRQLCNHLAWVTEESAQQLAPRRGMTFYKASMTLLFFLLQVHGDAFAEADLITIASKMSSFCLHWKEPYPSTLLRSMAWLLIAVDAVKSHLTTRELSQLQERARVMIHDVSLGTNDADGEDESFFSLDASIALFVDVDVEWWSLQESLNAVKKNLSHIHGDRVMRKESVEVNGDDDNEPAGHLDCTLLHITRIRRLFREMEKEKLVELIDGDGWHAIIETALVCEKHVSKWFQLWTEEGGETQSHSFGSWQDGGGSGAISSHMWENVIRMNIAEEVTFLLRIALRKEPLTIEYFIRAPGFFEFLMHSMTHHIPNHIQGKDVLFVSDMDVRRSSMLLLVDVLRVADPSFTKEFLSRIDILQAVFDAIIWSFQPRFSLLHVSGLEILMFILELAPSQAVCRVFSRTVEGKADQGRMEANEFFFSLWRPLYEFMISGAVMREDSSKVIEMVPDVMLSKDQQLRRELSFGTATRLFSMNEMFARHICDNEDTIHQWIFTVRELVSVISLQPAKKPSRSSRGRSGGSVGDERGDGDVDHLRLELIRAIRLLSSMGLHSKESQDLFHKLELGKQFVPLYLLLCGPTDDLSVVHEVMRLFINCTSLCSPACEDFVQLTIRGRSRFLNRLVEDALHPRTHVASCGLIFSLILSISKVESGRTWIFKSTVMDQCEKAIIERERTKKDSPHLSVYLRFLVGLSQVEDFGKAMMKHSSFLLVLREMMDHPTPSIRRGCFMFHENLSVLPGGCRVLSRPNDIDKMIGLLSSEKDDDVLHDITVLIGSLVCHSEKVRSLVHRPSSLEGLRKRIDALEERKRRQLVWGKNGSEDAETLLQSSLDILHAVLSQPTKDLS